MADYAVPECATGNDYAEHERTYALVMRLSKVATAAIILIVISLAIGGVAGNWALAGLGVTLALVTGAIGGISENGTIIPVALAAAAVVGLWFLFG